MFSRTTTTTWATPMPQLYQCSLVDLPCWEEVGRSQPSEWPLELHFVSLKVMVGYDNFSVWHLYTQAIPLHKLSEILCTFFLCIIFAGHHNHSQTLTVMHLWQDLKYAASQSTIRVLDRVGIRFVSWKALRKTSCLSKRITSLYLKGSWPMKWI